MRTGICILIGAALIAGSIAWIGRWEIAPQQRIVYRLDRWSGETVVCVVAATPAGVATPVPCAVPQVVWDK